MLVPGLMLINPFHAYVPIYFSGFHCYAANGLRLWMKSLWMTFCSSLVPCFSFLILLTLFISAEDTCPELKVGKLVIYSPTKTSYKSGATVTVRCQSGYKLNWLPSGNTLTCLNGLWNPSMIPSCTSKYSSKALMILCEAKFFQITWYWKWTNLQCLANFV